MPTALLIDGQNFLRKIKDVFVKENALREDKDIGWRNFDFNGLFNKVLEGQTFDYKHFYIAKISIHPRTEEKSRQLVERQRLLKTHLEEQGFNFIVAGKVRGYERAGEEPLFKEKGVDVRIAVDMITMSLLDKNVDKIILASFDSDLQPAIREIRKREREIPVEITYLGFEDLVNLGLAYTTHKKVLVRNSEVLSSYKP